MDDPLYSEALKRFGEWLEQAHAAAEPEPTAMTLATADVDGHLSARTVLLKGFDERGFSFYTNLGSNKGRQLQAHPVAALCFLWKTLERQVQIEGVVEPVTEAEADAYFSTRPRGSQVGAWASRQSQTLESRQALENAVARYEEQFANEPVPRPRHWSGFRLRPRMIELWQGREFRLHERWRYELSGERWAVRLLYP